MAGRKILDTAMGKRAEPIDLYFDTRYLRTYVRRERERKEKENPRVSSRRAYVRSTLASRSSLSLSLPNDYQSRMDESRVAFLHEETVRPHGPNHHRARRSRV